MSMSIYRVQTVLGCMRGKTRISSSPLNVAELEDLICKDAQWTGTPRADVFKRVKLTAQERRTAAILKAEGYKILSVIKPKEPRCHTLMYIGKVEKAPKQCANDAFNSNSIMFSPFDSGTPEHSVYCDELMRLTTESNKAGK